MGTVIRLSFAVMFCASSVFAADSVDFSREVLPILSDNCFYCHGPDASHRKAGLRLDDEAAAKKPGEEGVTAIIPGNSAKSEMIKRILSDDTDEIMPTPKSNKKLTKEQIATLKKWVDSGAGWGTHWAFSALKKPTLPATAQLAGATVRNPIDAFVSARLSREGLTQSPEADKPALIRRVTLDLTGLPPTPQDVDAFVADKAPDAYERVVDRLLASPRYGERMAWEWMEAARYSDTNGYQGDNERTMWPWRDWAVKAFNSNMPYDQFTIAQIAGDLLPNATEDQKLATGFLRNYPINGEGGRIAEENRIDYVMDMSETVATVWMGLTFTCARCHDHKFDPISNKDYYSLFAFFNQTPVTGGGGDPQTPPNMQFPTKEQNEKLAKLSEEVKAAVGTLETYEKTFFPREEGKPASDSETAKALEQKYKDMLKLSAEKRNNQQLDELAKHFDKPSPEYAKALKNVKNLRDQRNGVEKSIVRVMIMEDIKKPRKSFILEKGQYDKPGAEVTAATPAKLPPMPAGAPNNRLSLAQWLMAPEHPLTARVTVNRFWQSFFGIGLVKTSEDFGVQAEFPKYGELLDWLAADFRDNKWDVKRALRQIVTSATYRQSSKVGSALQQRDPENRLLARGARFRLPSWVIRDQALAASGLLVNKEGGPSVKVYQPANVWEEASFGNLKYKQDKGDALYRRSLYVYWRRIVGPTMFFDTPTRTVCAVKPMRTNTPLHALSTLNDVTFMEAARALAQRVLEKQTDCNLERMTYAYRLTLSRTPKDDEMKILQAGLERVKKEFAAKPEDAKKLLAIGESKRNEKLDPIEHAAWSAMCLAILNLDETLTKE